MALDAILSIHPRLRRCVVSCRHCEIRFLTHPRNAGRQNLRCLFGCRQHHRRQCANRRSVAYYQRANGRKAKKRRNAKRSHSSSATADAQPPAATDGELPAHHLTNSDPPQPKQPRPDHQVAGSLSEKVELRLGDVVLDASSLTQSRMLPYLQMVTWLIERIALHRDELVSLLLRALRQRSIANRRRTDYVLRFLHQHPP